MRGAQVTIMAALRHPNILLFMGMVIEPPCLVSEWCARGSLYDVLTKARKSPALAPALDWTRRLNMALDAAKARPPALAYTSCVLCTKGDHCFNGHHSCIAAANSPCFAGT